MTFQRVKLSGADPTGVLFTNGYSFLRGIHSDAYEAIKNVFEIGLIGALIERQLIPNTFILKDNIPDELKSYDLVLEHEAIVPITYPREWSFQMVCSAALAFLEINQIALRYGYICKDSHLFNFVFCGMIPVYVDIGSFVPYLSTGEITWVKDFYSGIFIPLQMWSDGAGLTASMLLSSPSRHLSIQEALILKSPWLRGSSKIKNRARKLFTNLYLFRFVTPNSNYKKILSIFKIDPLQVIQSFRKKILQLHTPNDTTWGHYHHEYLDYIRNNLLPERFQRILQIIQMYQFPSILELAGNAGILSEQIVKNYFVKKVICTDYDSCAIDQMYLRCKGRFGGKLQGAVLDFMAGEYSSSEISPEIRFRSDCVLALAVTHHLALTQGYSFEEIFSSIKPYARKVVMVEFMPLGLWNGKTAPVIPFWYTQDYFKREFENFFKIILIEQLEENRVLFVGEVYRLPNSDSDIVANYF